MRLAAIKPGDIVQINGFHAFVVRKEGRELLVQGICNKAMRRVRGPEVHRHWRQAKVNS